MVVNISKRYSSHSSHISAMKLLCNVPCRLLHKRYLSDLDILIFKKLLNTLLTFLNTGPHGERIFTTLLFLKRVFPVLANILINTGQYGAGNLKMLLLQSTLFIRSQTSSLRTFATKCTMGEYRLLTSQIS